MVIVSICSMFLVIQIGLNKQEKKKPEEGKLAGAPEIAANTNSASARSKQLLPEQWPHQPDDEKVAVDPSAVPLLQEIV